MTPVPTSSRSGGGYGKWLAVILIPVLAIITFSGGVAAGRGGMFGGGAAAGASPTPGTANANLDLVEEAWKAIHENYVDA
ncbi:MAG: hypothetical protein ABIR11_14145, partial [Candidatus Limnocylindrales bacterium]